MSRSMGDLVAQKCGKILKKYIDIFNIYLLVYFQVFYINYFYN